MYEETFLNLNPKHAFYINEFVGILAVLGASYQYFFFKNPHNKAQWYMHMILWGQTQIFWFLALFFPNNEKMRLNYARSSALTAFVPYIGAPIYLVWLTAYHIGDISGDHLFANVMIAFVFWVFYMWGMMFYSGNMLPALNNYAMELAAIDLEILLKQKKEQLVEFQEDETNAFENSVEGGLGLPKGSAFEPEEGDGILDEWIFG